jgi:hypothetical protein
MTCHFDIPAGERGGGGRHLPGFWNFAGHKITDTNPLLDYSAVSTMFGITCNSFPAVLNRKLFYSGGA